MRQRGPTPTGSADAAEGSTPTVARARAETRGPPGVPPARPCGGRRSSGRTRAPGARTAPIGRSRTPSTGTGRSHRRARHIEENDETLLRRTRARPRRPAGCLPAPGTFRGGRAPRDAAPPARAAGADTSWTVTPRQVTRRVRATPQHARDRGSLKRSDTEQRSSCPHHRRGPWQFIAAGCHRADARVELRDGEVPEVTWRAPAPTRQAVGARALTREAVAT